MLDATEMVDLYDCSQCSYQSELIFQLDHHIQKKHTKAATVNLFDAIVEPEQFSCVCCDNVTFYTLKLYDHYKHDHDPKSENEYPLFREKSAGYQCNCCIYASDSSLILIKHSCGKGSLKINQDSIEALDLIKAAAKCDKRLKCEHCSYRTKRNSDLKRHMLRHAPNDKINWVQCHLCPYRAKERYKLKRHMLQHATDEEINWFKCNRCDYKTKRKSSLKEHMLQHATDDEIHWFQCQYCTRRTKLKSNLTKHMLRHHADEVQSQRCSHCSLRANDSSSLEQINLVACSSCTNRAKLKRLTLQHAGKEINWLQCDHCSYRAKQKSSLKQHMLQHVTDEEINWFQCNDCSYQAKQKANLKRHILRHVTNEEEIRWFECDQCSHRTKHKSNLKKHMLRHPK